MLGNAACNFCGRFGSESSRAFLTDGSVLDKIKIKSDKKILIWNGWEISKGSEYSKIKAKKRFGKDDVMLSFETYVNSDVLDLYDFRRDHELGVEFKLDDNESLKMKLKDEESFVGLEHNMRF